MKNRSTCPWRKNALYGIALFVMALFLLSLSRLIRVMSYRSDELVVPLSDWAHAFWMGARFDAKWLSILFLPAFVTCLISLFLSPRIRAILAKYFLKPWLLLVLTVALSLEVINHFYFGFYQSPINSLIFGIFEDDTAAVLLTIWHDFPVLTGLLSLVTVLWLACWLANQLSKRCSVHLPGLKRRGQALLMLALLVGLGFLARGKLGVFPLRSADLAVSQHLFVNSIVANGMQALHMARSERKQSNLGRDPLAGLSSYGFAQPQDAMAILAQDARTTPFESWAVKQPQAQKPHVIVALMEGFGRDLIDTHDPEHNDVLGRLAPYLTSADFFSRAISIEHGTLPSLEGLLFDTPISPLMQSRYGYVPFAFSVVRPFHQAGFKVVFLTSGSSEWRGLNRNLLRQGSTKSLINMPSKSASHKP